jgi:hypothetical protein
MFWAMAVAKATATNYMPYVTRTSLIPTACRDCYSLTVIDWLWPVHQPLDLNLSTVVGHLSSRQSRTLMRRVSNGQLCCPTCGLPPNVDTNIHFEYTECPTNPSGFWVDNDRSAVLKMQITSMEHLLIQLIQLSTEAWGSLVDWGTILQARRSWVRFPMRSLDFLNSPNLSSRTMALGSTQPLTEMSTRNVGGSKGRQGRKADNLTAICKPTV